MKLSDKYKVFLKHNSKVEFLEGTTFAGKTTVGVIKFMLKIAKSEKKFHILSGLDLGTIEKNIINAELGIIDIFGDLVKYYPNGVGDTTLPHIKFRDKLVYVLGYDNKARWKKALGGQYGCVYIDEINIADMDYIREVFLRFDYAMATLNPDNPDLEVYTEYINKSRPLKEYEKDYPSELLEMLDGEVVKDWVHWYFTFRDNTGITPEKVQQLLDSGSKESKVYKNKILGLRGRATGLIFNLQNSNIITECSERFTKFTCGVDTSYSMNSNDTISFIFGGITIDHKYIVLDEQTYNNKDLIQPLTPSDIPIKLIAFLNNNQDKWGFAKSVFIDSADSGTILECNKYKQKNGSIYDFIPAYKQTKVLDRVNLQAGWLASGNYLIMAHCKEHIKEHNTYSWNETKDIPEDRNDHTINASQYGWLPYKDKIGVNGGKNGNNGQNW